MSRNRYGVRDVPPPSSLCGKRHLVRCCVDAYVTPTRPGDLRADERDALALQVALRWHDKAPTGSCAWHEIAAYRGTPCRCAPCRRAAVRAEGGAV